MGLISLAGRCRGKRGCVETISSMSFSVGRKRFVTIVNTSKDKGSALVGLVDKLRGPARKYICIRSMGLARLSLRRRVSFHE